MKKIILLCLSFVLFVSLFSQPLTAKEDDTSILIRIEGAKDLYLLKIKENTMNVYIIPEMLYLPIACLENQKSTLKGVDFSSSYDCLLTTINQALNQKVPYYANIKMEKLLSRLNLKKNTYDYKTLDSLCDTGKKIKENLDMGVLIDYQKYLKTNIDFDTIYKLYQFFQKDKIKINYFTQNYFVVNNKYFLITNDFYLKKKAK